jgi:ATP-binding cassette subfamily B protein/subfamily B ATP-binding cassette protein MsbA
MARYRTLLRYALPVWKTLLLIAAVTLAASVMAMVEPWPMKVLVDHVLSAQPMTGGASSVTGMLPGASTPVGLLAWVAIAGLLFYAVGSTMEVVLTDAWVRAGQRMSFGLAADVFSRLQRRSILFHNRTSVGDSMARVLTDSWSVNTVVDALLFKPVHALLTAAGILLIMVQLNPRLTAVALLVVPLMVASSTMAGRRIRNASKEKRAAGVRINTHLQQSLSGMSVTQAFAQETEEQRRFSVLAAKSIRADQRATVVAQLNGLASGLVTTAGAGVVLYIGARQVMAGRLTLGGLLVFIAYLKTLQGKFKSLAGSYALLQSVDASVDRVISALGDPDLPEKSNALSVKRARGHVRLQDVTFAYEAGRPVLQDVSFEASPGETVAIAGPTGAGKSTLVSLIPRMFDPSRGLVLLDNMDVRDLRLRDLRRQVAWVPQETFLFPASVAENIAFGRPGASRKEIEAVARAAEADAFIEQLPEGYDTVLGERGMTLSGGERQRLAIARAMLVDAPILILDEPTSAIDAETDAMLQAALRNMAAERTVIVIAHRLSTIRNADRVIRLEHGRILDIVSRGVA